MREWRRGLTNFNRIYFGKKYERLLDEIGKFVSALQEKGKETDIYIEIGKLRLRKAPLSIDTTNFQIKEKNKIIFRREQYFTDDFVYEYAREDFKYYGLKNYPLTTTGVMQVVVNNPNNPMYVPVQEAINNIKQDGYRPVIKVDFEEILSALPGNDEREKFLALEIIS